MNRRKFIKLLGGLLAVLLFVKKRLVSEQATKPSNWTDSADIISYDTFAEDGYVVFFNMTAEQTKEAKAKWRAT